MAVLSACWQNTVEVVHKVLSLPTPGGGHRKAGIGEDVPESQVELSMMVGGTHVKRHCTIVPFCLSQTCSRRCCWPSRYCGRYCPASSTCTRFHIRASAMLLAGGVQAALRTIGGGCTWRLSCRSTTHHGWRCGRSRREGGGRSGRRCTGRRARCWSSTIPS